MNEGAAGLGPPERLHPISLLSSLTASLRGMWGLFAAGGYFAVQGRWGIAVAMIVIFALFSLSAAFLRWTKFRFQVGARDIRIDSGLLSRTHRVIPFDRIQDVTVEQGPLARALGLARVRFETGGSAAANSDDGSLAAIPLERASQIRDLVRASRGLVPAAAAVETIETAGEPVFAMDLNRVLLAGVFNFSLAVVGGLIGLSQTMGDALGFDPFNRRFWTGLFAPGSPVGDFILAHQLVTALAGAVTLILIGLATGLIRTTLRDYGFRLDRTATGLRRRRGLLTLTDVVLPAKRTQAAVIGSGPLRARFGWSELKLQSLAKEEGGKGDHVVAPLADEMEIGTVLNAIGWNPAGRPEWRRVSLAYVWTFALALSPLILLLTAQTLFFGYATSEFQETPQDSLPDLSGAALISLAALVALVAMIPVRWLAWRRYGYVFDGDRLLVRSGWWRRRVKILPLKNIQSLDFTQIFVDRWFDTANLTIGVAGGGLAGHGIKALPTETARQLRDRLLSKFA